MPSFARSLVLCLAGFLVVSSASGCTLVKPVVGAVTGPVVLLAASGGQGIGCGCQDGRAILVLFAVAAAIGAGGGLVTGIISDVQALCGVADDPCRNWQHPFATNTGASR